MKLYMHPVSTTSRPIRLLIAERELPVEEQVVDLFSGAHHQPPFSEMNPNKLVPVLQDGDFVLTESQAILQYLADKFELRDLYPADLKKRATINERLDWFNTVFFREYGYGFCYPQLYPHHERQNDEAQAKTLEWSAERAKAGLKVLDEHWIGKNDFCAGDTMSIADLSGVCMVTVGEVNRVDLGAYPNIQRWIARMKQDLSKWDEINEAHHGFRDSVADQEFVAL
jgi:glutathione S-transferase